MGIETKQIEEISEALSAKFDEFKQKNDKIAEAVKGEVVGLKDQVEKQSHEILEFQKMKDKLDELMKKQNRIANPGDGMTREQREHKDAFMKFMVKGEESGLAELQQKALNLGADADGGYAVPEVIDRQILSLLRDETPMRAVARQITVSTSDYKKLVNLHGAASGWVGETAARPGTNTPTLAEVSPFMGEIYANPGATQRSLDDVFFNAEQWLSDEVREEFSEQENLAFTSGDGTNKPKGFLDYATATTGDDVRAFGTLQHVVSGSAGAIVADDIKRFPFRMRKKYRMGATWMGSTDTLADIMVLKDANGQYLWQPGLQEGQPSRLGGYRYIENEDMPAVAANAKALAFGNFQRGYYIVDRIGTRVLRDPYTNKPYVHFYTTKRVGGMVVDSNAIKLLQIAA